MREEGERPGDGGGGSFPRDLAGPGLGRLLGLVRRLGAGGELRQLLQELAVAVGDILEFDAVAVHLVGVDGDLRVVAVGGSPDVEAIRDSVTERRVVDDLVERAGRWGTLCFVDHRRAGGAPSSTPAGPAGSPLTGGGTWHSGYVLLAPMHSSGGSLLGLVSVDRPRTGRVPSTTQLVLLELLAAEGANAIEDELRRKELAAHQGVYQSVFHVSPIGIAVLDTGLNVLEANRAYGLLLGRPASALAGVRLTRLLDEADGANVVEHCRRLFQGVSAPTSLEHGYLRPGAEQRWARSSFTVVRSTDPGDRVVVTSEDITADRRARSERQELAGNDTLTGLPNRRAALEQITAALHRRRPGQQTGVLYLDLDGFKLINETYGHTVGDDVLKSTTQRLRDVLRGGEQLYRMGDDELAVLCEDLRSRRGAEILAERLIASLEAAVSLPPITVPASVSIGIAVAGDERPPVTSLELVRAAETALREAKRLGPRRWYCAVPAERRKTAPR
ncbi:MAG: hypothetical protein JWO62_1785 [Acidimicrobiaceae bacterium]|jgi:diguanylate cyclase (GGDEF)-like protein/PAS domain S-box-containing protein|nr:hypothetical protein [Acidimicrobiaceae bacterium]